MGGGGGGGGHFDLSKHFTSLHELVQLTAAQEEVDPIATADERS
jgi:hypothetical protein